MRKPVNLPPLFLVVWAAAAGFVAVLWFVQCGGTQPSSTTPNEVALCAQTLVMTRELESQAAKLGLEPFELARKTCEDAWLAYRLAVANLQHSQGNAGCAGLSTADLAGAGAGGL